MIRKKLRQLKNEVGRRLNSLALQRSALSKQSTQIPDTDGLPTGTNPSKEEAESLSIVSSIKDLPLKDFIECCVNENYSVLIKSGEIVTQIDAEKVYYGWLSLLSQYYEISGDSEQARQFSIIGRMKSMECRKQIIETCVEILKANRVESLIDTLKELYPELEFTDESYTSDLNTVINNEKVAIVDYNLLKEELEDIVKKQGIADEKINKVSLEERIYNELLDINKVENGSYSEEISTYKFALLRKRLIAHIEQLKKQK